MKPCGKNIDDVLSSWQKTGICPEHETLPLRSDSFGRNALHVAAFLLDYPVMEFLLDKGVSPNTELKKPVIQHRPLWEDRGRDVDVVSFGSFVQESTGWGYGERKRDLASEEAETRSSLNVGKDMDGTPFAILFSTLEKRKHPLPPVSLLKGFLLAGDSLSPLLNSKGETPWVRLFSSKNTVLMKRMWEAGFRPVENDWTMVFDHVDDFDLGTFVSQSGGGVAAAKMAIMLSKPKALEVLISLFPDLLKEKELSSLFLTSSAKASEETFAVWVSHNGDLSKMPPKHILRALEWNGFESSIGDAVKKELFGFNLKKRQGWENFLHKASSSGRLPVIQSLLEHGWSAASLDKTGRSPFSLAIKNQHWIAGSFLLPLSDVSVRFGKNGDFCLHKACEEGASAFVKEFVAIHPELVWNPNLVGETAFQKAMTFKKESCVKELLMLPPNNGWSFEIEKVGGFAKFFPPEKAAALEKVALASSKVDVLKNAPRRSSL